MALQDDWDNFVRANGQSGRGNSGSGHKIGENGTATASTTVGKRGKTERIDVENPNPGQRDGQIHYHEADDTKWLYDINNNKFVDPKTGKDAPSRIQKLLKEEWVIKAIKKGLRVLGE